MTTPVRFTQRQLDALQCPSAPRKRAGVPVESLRECLRLRVACGMSSVFSTPPPVGTVFTVTENGGRWWYAVAETSEGNLHICLTAGVLACMEALNG